MWGKRSIPPPDDDVQDTAQDDARQMRAAQRDLTQFAPVYERYVDRIHAYCCYRVGESDAEDVTSQVFVQAMNGVAGYRGGSVAAWLFRIAHNCVVDHLRYRRPHISVDEHEIDFPADSADLFDRIADAERIDMLRQIITALLDDEQIDLLTLKLTSRLNSAEIGEVVGKSAVAVRVEISRMMLRIRTRYREMTREADS
jgi:RNA polymerase sigma-70 factor (ECF subfamily)